MVLRNALPRCLEQFMTCIKLKCLLTLPNNKAAAFRTGHTKIDEWKLGKQTVTFQASQSIQQPIASYLCRRVRGTTLSPVPGPDNRPIVKRCEHQAGKRRRDASIRNERKQVSSPAKIPSGNLQNVLPIAVRNGSRGRRDRLTTSKISTRRITCIRWFADSWHTLNEPQRQQSIVHHFAIRLHPDLFEHTNGCDVHWKHKPKYLAKAKRIETEVEARCASLCCESMAPIFGMKAIPNINHVQFGQVFQPAESNDCPCLFENARPATIAHFEKIGIFCDRLSRRVERSE
ncbi:hypothetical protein Enr13x_20040 [Stieleria neptunia]|uniref:Uncharacterized protein n=1 Tax=Stieleria neptunia TaxID=2527979 RepID=A0A518HMT4_9BACT|nr:hypothetical protein Enr13x_20040 [Stieleria neptunia]